MKTTARVWFALVSATACTTAAVTSNSANDASTSDDSGSTQPDASINDDSSFANDSSNVEAGDRQAGKGVFFERGHLYSAAESRSSQSGKSSTDG